MELQCSVFDEAAIDRHHLVGAQAVDAKWSGFSSYSRAASQARRLPGTLFKTFERLYRAVDSTRFLPKIAPRIAIVRQRGYKRGYTGG
jgi:hypothetical protein